MEEYNDIIEIIHNTPLVQPPDALTAGVMEKIAAGPEKRFYTVQNFFTKPRHYGINPVAALKNGTTREECLLYFMMAGFTHLILALVLFWGLGNLYMGNQTIFWLRIQPQIVLFLTCWLIIAGIAMLTGRIGIRFSMLMSSAYVAIIVFNGIVLIGVIDKPIFRIPVIGLFSATFLMGIFLVLVIKKHLEKNDFEKSRL
jgi:hypothetical protein